MAASSDCVGMPRRIVVGGGSTPLVVVDELPGLLLQAAASTATEQMATATAPFRKPAFEHVPTSTDLGSCANCGRRPVTGVTSQSPARSSLRGRHRLYTGLMGRTSTPRWSVLRTNPSLGPGLRTVRRPPTWQRMWLRDALRNGGELGRHCRCRDLDGAARPPRQVRACHRSD